MLWFLWAVCSAVCLGFYDVLKKQSLRDNAVMPVLLLNTLFCSLFFIPLILFSSIGEIVSTSHWYVPLMNWEAHLWVFLKAILVLSSWICGYYAIKHLPLTLVGPINATRPVMVLLGALMLFQEQLNTWQWVGVILAIISVFLLSRSGKKEGIHFLKNPWILLLSVAAFLGACSGLYDKFLLAPTAAGGLSLSPMFVQSWYNCYQLLLMCVLCYFLYWRTGDKRAVFHWRWSILGISLFLSAADLAYFFALSQPDALIAVVSMTRRSSVLVSFLCAALFLREKNLRRKSFDLLIVLISMLCLCAGALYN